MKALIITLLIVCSFGFYNDLAADEIVKWVDEKGKIHFGDKVPPQYKDQAEQVETKPTIIIAPDEKVRQQNRDIVSRYKREAAQQQKKKNKPEHQSSGNQLPREPVKTREWCRNTYNNKVKDRTECFNAVAAQ